MRRRLPRRCWRHLQSSRLWFQSTCWNKHIQNRRSAYTFTSPTDTFIHVVCTLTTSAYTLTHPFCTFINAIYPFPNADYTLT